LTVRLLRFLSLIFSLAPRSPQSLLMLFTDPCFYLCNLSPWLHFFFWTCLLSSLYYHALRLLFVITVLHLVSCFLFLPLQLSPVLLILSCIVLRLLFIIPLFIIPFPHLVSCSFFLHHVSLPNSFPWTCPPCVMHCTSSSVHNSFPTPCLLFLIPSLAPVSCPPYTFMHCTSSFVRNSFPTPCLLFLISSFAPTSCPPNILHST